MISKAQLPTDCLSRPWQDRLAAASGLWDSGDRHLYYFSSKFLQADGGWRRIMDVQESQGESKGRNSEEIYSKIATEEDAEILSLKEFPARSTIRSEGVVRPVDDKDY